MDAGKDAATKDAAADATTSDAAMDAAVDASAPSGDDGGGPECTQASDCGTNSLGCASFQCNGGTCVETFIPSGMLALGAGAQTAGDCHRVECNGSGGSNDVVDDSDPPVDDKECTTDVCTAGTGSHGPVTANTGCTEGGGAYCDGVDACVECNIQAHCGTNTECVTFACTAHQCIATFTANGTALTTGQTVGDCQEVQCDGAGATKTVASSGDNTDNNECTTDSCNGTTAVHTPVGDGGVCTVGGSFCKGGTCSGCAIAANCGTSTECRTFTCPGSGTCQTDDAPGDTPLSSGMQTAGDCLEIQCDGGGDVKSVMKTSDVPSDDGNQCTDEVCSGTTPMHPPAAINSPCTVGGAFCDSSGSCVACNMDSQCSPQICIDKSCIATGSIGGVSATPTTLVAGATGSLTIGFTTAHKWAGNGVLSLVFPAGYSIASATAALTGADGAHSVLLVGNELLITRTSGTTAAPGTFSVEIDLLRNPQVSGSAGAITIDTKTAAGVSIDSGSTGAATITPGLVGSPLATPSATVAGATIEMVISGVSANPVPADARIDFEFPATFDVSGATLVDGAPDNGTYVLSVSGQVVTVTRNGDGTVIAGGTAFFSSLGGIVAPASVGPTSDFVITSRTSAGAAIDTGVALGYAAICGGDLACPGGTYCGTLGACLPKTSQGTACGRAGMCQNGNCVDGFCCSSACTSECQACSTAMGATTNGTCSTKVGTPPPGDCTSAPAAFCTAQMRTSYTAPGMCGGGGACAYSSSTGACPNGCYQGACNSSGPSFAGSPTTDVGALAVTAGTDPATTTAPADTSVVVTVSITPHDSVMSLTLSYTTDDFSSTTPVSLAFSQTSGANDQYSATIPAQAVGTTVRFYVTAVPFSGPDVVSPGSGDNYTYEAL